MAKRIGLMAAAAMSMMAVAGMGAPVERVDLTRGTVVVTTPAAPQQQRQAPARVISARQEVDRVDDLFYVERRSRRAWDGKNRTSGDRAHKRLKQRRRAGRLSRSPDMSTPSKKPAPKSTAKPLLVAGTDVVKTKVTPSRPVLLESDVFRKEIGKRYSEVVGEIDLIDASERQADADFDNAVRMLTEKRDAERQAQAHRRADLTRIADGCRAALDASEAAAA